MRTSLLLALFALGGCSAKGDLEKICNAEALSGAASVADPMKKGTKIAAYLRDNVRTSEGQKALNDLRFGMPVNAERGALLREAAKEVGYTGPCPMADSK